MSNRQTTRGARRPMPRPSTDNPSAADLQLTAFRILPTSCAIRPAPVERAWMDATDRRFAYRCLPLAMANQAGWIVTGGSSVTATWNGGDDPDDLLVQSDDAEEPAATSHFGHGILTWEMPFLFRTPPGWNLLVRGPANFFKDGASPLEGLVETDWAVATFTVNWKLTRPKKRVRFEADDPVCMLVPQRRGELEAFRPAIKPLASEPALRRHFGAWSRSRLRLVRRLEDPSWPPARPTTWQLHYLRGTSPSGASADRHQTRLRLAPFVEAGAPRRGRGSR